MESFKSVTDVLIRAEWLGIQCYEVADGWMGNLLLDVEDEMSLTIAYVRDWKEGYYGELMYNVRTAYYDELPAEVAEDGKGGRRIPMCQYLWFLDKHQKVVTPEFKTFAFKRQ